MPFRAQFERNVGGAVVYKSEPINFRFVGDNDSFPRIPAWQLLDETANTTRLKDQIALVGFTAEQPEIRRGIDFLVATQSADGTWPMISRSTPDGSPGSSKLLSPILCGASSWATLSLSRLSPKERR